MKGLFGFLVLIFVQAVATGQDRTVGLISIEEGIFEGYTLFAPAGNTTTYLINDCGELVHQWDSDYFPGNSVYLMEDGSVYRASRVDGARLGEPGVGGRIERISWDNEVIWSYVYANDTVNAHHDFQVLPNGNVLILAWELKTFEEAVQAGRDPNTLPDNELWPDHLVEVQPAGDTGEIVWRWTSWDHLIQDFDPTKDNFGVVADNPGKIDINFYMDEGADWHHVNSVSYSPEYDQIILSVPFFDEIWIIDHGITTEEAKGEKGDLLFRWGNPETYQSGDVRGQQLFFQHTAQWIPEGHPNEGEIIIFNNGRGREPEQYSSVVILDPFDADGNYFMEDGVFGPSDFVFEYTKSNPTDFYAGFISGAQQLANGNLLINDGPKGTFFEVTLSGEVVWTYVNPVSTTQGVLSQGDMTTGNLVFRAIRYPMDFEAFEGRNLDAQGYIERNPFGDPCDSGDPVLTVESTRGEIYFYPNPASDGIDFNAQVGKVDIFDINGNLVLSKQNLKKHLPLENLSSGIYFIKIEKELKKLIVKK